MSLATFFKAINSKAAPTVLVLEFSTALDAVLSKGSNCTLLIEGHKAALDVAEKPLARVYIEFCQERKLLGLSKGKYSLGSGLKKATTESINSLVAAFKAAVAKATEPIPLTEEEKALRKAKQIDNAILILEKNGYRVILPERLTL